MRLAAALFVMVSLGFGYFSCGELNRAIGPYQSLEFAAEPFLPHDVRIDGKPVDPEHINYRSHGRDPIVEYRYTGRRAVRVRVLSDSCTDDSFCFVRFRPGGIDGSIRTEAP